MALSKEFTGSLFNHPFFNGHGIEEFLAPSPFARDSIIEDLVPVFPDGSKLVMSSPGFHVNETEDKYEIAVDLPGVHIGEVSVNLEHEGRVLHIAGGRKVVKDDSTTETKFDKRFTLGKNIDAAKMTATLADGVLTLTAPKKADQEKPSFNIPIMDGSGVDEKKET